MAEHMRIEHTGAGRRGTYQWVDDQRWMIIDSHSSDPRGVFRSKEEALERVKAMASNGSCIVGDWIIVRMDVIAPYQVRT